MSDFRVVDIENWARKEHYKYYTEKLKIEFNMTANIDVKELLEFCHTGGYKFYPAFICCVTRAMNRLENFRMFRNSDGTLCVWDKVVPNYTIFHEDDHTFSDCWSEHSDDFDEFYQNIVSDMEHYKDVKGIKVKSDQPANFYCVSCAPWTAFTGYGSRVTNGEPAFFPIITAGKYEHAGDKINMPVNITIAHAVADGYHVGLFFDCLQEEIRNCNLKAI